MKEENQQPLPTKRKRGRPKGSKAKNSHPNVNPSVSSPSSCRIQAENFEKGKGTRGFNVSTDKLVVDGNKVKGRCPPFPVA